MKAIVRKQQERMFSEPGKPDARFTVGGKTVVPEKIERFMKGEKISDDQLYLPPSGAPTPFDDPIECWTPPATDNISVTQAVDVPIELRNGPARCGLAAAGFSRSGTEPKPTTRLGLKSPQANASVISSDPSEVSDTKVHAEAVEMRVFAIPAKAPIKLYRLQPLDPPSGTHTVEPAHGFRT
ncbi:hypothetical protein B0T24DRAFT_593177 [Lasiosphaeria ovina]|uniref:Uncharacterized protein n=1 Tax=Lasiosphaeria ovina TaxID=92902 RepID=A0AAE0KA90_9PEZI|nr:hypothetical protein B0T24DRAFT_593177 [Lasiosphaeria ovina]